MPAQLAGTEVAFEETSEAWFQVHSFKTHATLMACPWISPRCRCKKVYQRKHKSDNPLKFPQGETHGIANQ